MPMDKRQKMNIILIAVCSVLIVIALSIKLKTYVLPKVTDYVAEKIPQSVVESVGKSGLESLDESEFQTSELSDEKQEELRQLFLTLLPSETDEQQYVLKFRAWSDKANALALANGQIVVTDGLVHLLKTEAQMAAVLLHEIGHVEHKHVMKNLVNMTLSSILFTVILGDFTTLGPLLANTATIGTYLDHSRDAELQADSYATDKLNVLYENNDAMIQALLLLESAQETEIERSSWFSTHPDTETRVQALKQNNGLK